MIEVVRGAVACESVAGVDTSADTDTDTDDALVSRARAEALGLPYL